MAFRCPACLQQVVCTTEDAGCDMECPFCQAMLRLPPVDGAGRVELLSTTPVAGSRTDVMKAHLPELRDEEEGRSGSALFQEMQPIRPEEVEGTDDWGLDRAARVENVRRSRALPYFDSLVRPRNVPDWQVARSRPQNFRNWRGWPNRRRSPASARMVRALIGPIPGIRRSN